MADYIAADPEVLLAGGVDLAKISAIIRQLEEELEWTADARYYTGNGEDHITEVLDKVYLPSAEACKEFIRMLKELIVQHGQSVVDSGHVLSAADNNAAGAAGRRA